MIAQNEVFINDLLLPLQTKGSHLNFPLLIDYTCRKIEESAREQIKNFLEKMDKDFRNYPGRTSQYYVKDTRNRTIISMFGEITYNRTIYLDRATNNRYCYVDEKMGIDKWIRYTNDVASFAYQCYGNRNSMIKIGEEIGNSIHAKYTIEDKNDLHTLSRQTIYNLIHRIGEVRVKEEGKKQCEDIYILLDEKFIASNKKDDSKMMVKVCLITEGLDSKCKRHKYINPYYFSQYDGKFSDNLLDLIDDKYDITHLKNIHVLSDGGGWIKSVKEDIRFANVKTISYLDYYHFTKTIWKITKDKDVYKTAMNYLINNSKNDLKTLLDLYNSDGKKDDEINYIFSNYKEIQNMIHLKGMNCAMEQVISHHIASQFTSVPKAYNREKIDHYLSLRDNTRNKKNNISLFLKVLDLSKNNKDKITIKKEDYDFSIFDKVEGYHEYSTSNNNGYHLEINNNY